MKQYMVHIIEKIVREEGEKFLHLTEGYVKKDLSFTPQKNPSLYIHIPFCKILCPYCCFNRYPYHLDECKRYFQALKKELFLYKEQGFSFQEVYFGGGTPTVDIPLLVDLLETLRSTFPIQLISLEANPCDLSPPTVLTLKQNGVNRLSIGVQSFSDRLLKEMGRHSHGAKEAIEAIERCTGEFDTVNVDCIYNFPTQTPQDLQYDIETIKILGVDQVTFYPLMPSPHKKTALEKRFNQIDQKRESSMYNLLQDSLSDTFTPSTCWCFSRGKHSIDEYIINHPEYVGIGAGSVGFLNDTFFVNTFSLSNYIQITTNHQFPIIRSKKATHKESARYFLLTQLFGMKLDANEVLERYGSALSTELFLLRIAGIIAKKNASFITTKKGMFYIGLMMKNFFTSLNRLREICISDNL